MQKKPAPEKKKPAKGLKLDNNDYVITPDDPICPYFDRKTHKCASSSCPRLHGECKFWEGGVAPIFTTGE